MAAAPPDRKATHRHLFLKEVAEWLDKQLGELDYTRLLVCAAAECYGSLPALVHERLKPRLIFEALELMPLPVSDLPDHKRIRRYLDSGS